MKPTHALTVFIAAAAALAAVPPANASRPKPIACGDTITRSVRLDRDLTDCPSNGIVIGADGITLDLNGHVIDGDGVTQECDPSEDCDLGVANTGGHRGVKVKGGTIREFALGGLVAGADDNHLRDLSVTANEFAGLVAVDAGGTVITRSAVTHNGLDTEGTGIVLVNAHDSRVTHDVSSANGDTGIFAGSSEQALLADNVVADQPLGIVTDRVQNSEITRNRAVRDGGPIILIGDHNRVSGNYVADTVRCPDGGCGQGISFEGGTGNVIEHNLVERTLEAGIRVAAFEPDTPPADGNTVRHNLIIGALDGIFVEETATHTVLEGNVAVRSADDGIDVDNAATTLTRNAANRNRDLGIDAVAGVTDGGHNRARRNGNPAQCLNITCG